ncbi:hypothetical protein Vretimale_15954 [Volvox reticuliferus]|uniref:Uncharacterized protein n=1 Tax=Volvox reticuliferus TaxID=1737510 RepID=A0A8J4GSD8_9CHLO|nr:hypothetical protein Vretimale_15954 [Volvox reticuliferus]
MEEIEKLKRKISDLEAETRVLLAKAESAEDTEDKKYYRALVLKKLDRLLMDEKLLVKKFDRLLKEEELLLKEEELLLTEEELLLKKEEKEILLLEKDKDLRKENLLRLQRLGARGEFEWYDGAARRNMLDCDLPMAGIKLRGSCDIALCTSAAVMGNMPEKGLRIVVELKKDEVNFNPYQLAVELLVANQRSPFLKPIGVMTDLMDAWRLMWAAEDSIMVYYCRGRRAEAIGILRAFLEQELLMPDSGSIMHQQDKGGPEAEVGGLLKRRRLRLASGAR